MRKKFKERFEFVGGNSAKQVPKYASSHRGDTFDLIFIDGCHTFKCLSADIRNCQKLAHRDTLLWIDDYPIIHAVKLAVEDCIENGIIILLDAKSVEDSTGTRSWAIAQFSNR